MANGFVNCPGSGTQASARAGRDLCVHCGRRYAITKRGTIRNHVDRTDRYRASMDAGHARTQAFIAQMRKTYPAT